MGPKQRDNPPRMAIYARQSAAEDQGIRQQLADCREEALRRGLRVVAEYKDDTTSGSRDRGANTDWAKMLKAFDAGDFEGVLVNDVDRLTRSLADVLEVRPPKRDVRVLTVRGGIDTETDDFMFKQLVLLAEREVKLKADRARRYAVARRQAGHPKAGKTPHGYKWVPKSARDDNDTRYVVDEDEAPDVRQIFGEFLAGASLGQIARDLTADGKRTRTGARWHTSTVRRVLLNPLYAALLPPAQPTGMHDLTKIAIEECSSGAWESIVDEDTIKASRGRLIGVKPNHQGTARRWLLSGLAVCGVCKEPVRSARGETHPTARKDGTGAAPSLRYHAYRCVNGHFMRNGDIVDEYITEVCIAYLSVPENVKLLARRPDGPDIGVLHSQRIALQSRQATIASMIATGKMTPDAAEEALDKLALEIRDIDSLIASAANGSPASELLGIVDVRAWWTAATLARRRSVIAVLMSVAINPVGSGRRVTTVDAAAKTVDVEWRQQA